MFELTIAFTGNNQARQFTLKPFSVAQIIIEANASTLISVSKASSREGERSESIVMSKNTSLSV